MASAPRDPNRKVVLQGVSKVDKKTPTPIAVNPTTKAVIVEVV